VWKKPDAKLLAFLLGTAIGVMATLSLIELYIKNVIENGFVGVRPVGHIACGGRTHMLPCLDRRCRAPPSLSAIHHNTARFCPFDLGHTVNPRLMSCVPSSDTDAVGDICQAPARHVIEPRHTAADTYVRIEWRPVTHDAAGDVCVSLRRGDDCHDVWRRIVHGTRAVPAQGGGV